MIRRWFDNPWTWFYLVFFLFFIHLACIHLVPDPQTTARANCQYWLEVPLSTTRGEILDRNGIPLAISIPATSLFVDPLKWETTGASQLQGLLPEGLIQDLAKQQHGRFKWIRRKMTPQKAQEVLALNLPGIYPLKEKKRVYPNESLLAHALGYCDVDDLGLSGSERFWNSELYSPPSLTVIGRDGAGNPANLFGIPSISGTRTEGHLQLTIDARIQHILESNLHTTARSWKAKWGAALCLSPRTGEILGMASWPTFNPNERSTFRTSLLRNNVIGRVYEPGSTFKPIIMGLALDRKVVSLRDRFYSPGFIRIADHIIQNYHRKAFGWEYPADILINSCNVGMSQIGMKMDILSTHGSLWQWGFGHDTGVELPGEEQGLLPPADQWLGVVPANIAIGQGIAVTPLQLARAVAAIANGGHLLKPHLVLETRNANGQTTYQAHPELIRDVLSPKTAAWLRRTMRDVVQKGSGKRADSPIVQLAGKTGTAQIAEKGIYAKGRYVTSFVGYWPWDSPQMLILMAIGEPEGRNLSGGKVAAPAVRKIAEDIEGLQIQRKQERQ